MNSSKKFENLLNVESMQKKSINKHLKVISMSVKKRGKKIYQNIGSKVSPNSSNDQ
jgi:hypothetical protein